MNAYGRFGAVMVLALVLVLVSSSIIAAPPTGPDKLADFEGGVPDGWFVFQGASTVLKTLPTAPDDGDSWLTIMPAGKEAT